MRSILSHSRCEGLTLIELMLAVLVLAMSVSIGTPALQSLREKNQLRMESNRLLLAVNLARSAAVMRNMPVSLCPSAMAATGEAHCGGTYADGWIVFANQNKDRIVDEGEDEVLEVFAALPKNYRVTNRSGSRAVFELVNYLPDGTSHSNRTFKICPPDTSQVESIAVVLNIVGRARLDTGLGQCDV